MSNSEQCCAQAQHGSAPDIAGKNLANPTSMILSVTMLLRWLGEKNNSQSFVLAAEEIEQALEATLENPATRTKDLGGTFGCSEFSQEILSRLI